MSENKEPEIIVEDQEKDDLLEKFEQPKAASKPKGKNGNFLILIVCLIGAILLGVIITLLLLLPKDSETKDYISGTAPVKATVGEDKVHQAELETSADGKISENGSGTLIEKVPAEIKKIEIENEGGSFTVTSYTPKNKKGETDTTEYTLVGFEGFDLQTGAPDEIANVCANLTFSSVSSEDATGKLQDFGLDNPRSIATVTYTDKTKAVFKVGAEAPQGLGTYVMFGDKNTVYLCGTEAVEPLLFSVNDLISLAINDAASDNDSTDAKTVNISGTAFPSGIKLKLNSDTEHIANKYLLVSPVSAYADDTASGEITGALRGLYADSVRFVNPTASQLSSVGLDNPYAVVSATFSDISVKLLASKPDSEGNVCIMKSGGNVVYKMKSASLGWVTTNVDKLISDYVLNAELASLSGLKISAGGESYKFDIKTTVTKTTNDEGEETSSSNTVTTVGGEELDEGNFETFYRNLSLLTKAENTVAKPSGKPALSVTYVYEKGRKADSVEFYKSSGNKYVVTVNSAPSGTVYANYVEKLIKQASSAAVDKTVKSFW